MTSQYNFMFDFVLDPRVRSVIMANYPVARIPEKYINLLKQYRFILNNLAFELIRLNYHTEVIVIRRTYSSLYPYDFKVLQKCTD